MDVKTKPKVHMVDLINQYARLKSEIDPEIQEVLDSAYYIKGPKVAEFEQNFAQYLDVKTAIGCANGTDALQVALMALNLKQGDEVIVPSFTFVATAEVIALLKLKPVMVDVDPNHFNITPEIFEAAITPKTKAVVPVHLFGQSADIEQIVNIARKHKIYVVEDNAQAIGSDVFLRNGNQIKSGTLGDIGCTSFFPAKNLGCFGDGGAVFTNNEELGRRIRMIANHGEERRYYHDKIGCNSRLDAIQAAVLNVKLRHLDSFNQARQNVAEKYDEAFHSVSELTTPTRVSYGNHIFHQYTLKVLNGKRDHLRDHLNEAGIPCGIYYPLPLNKQEAFQQYVEKELKLPNTEILCEAVLSLPVHTEMKSNIQDYIIENVVSFFQS